MDSHRTILVLLILALLLIMLGACAPAASPAVEMAKTEAPAKPVEEESPGEPIKEGQPTQASQAPAAEEPEQPEPSLPQATPLPTPLPPPAPLSTLVILPTQPPEAEPTSAPTQTPIVEQRNVEVEWPPRMRLGESDVVRLALIPSQAGYTITTEYPEHQTITQTIDIPRPGGYYLFVAARLDGVGFNLSPTGDQVQSLPPGEIVSWRWSLTPRAPGRQRLSITLKLRWEPLGENAPPPQEVVAYSSGLDVRVLSFLGLTQSQALLAGTFGLFFGGGLSLFALVARPRERRRPFAPIAQAPNPDLAIELPPELRLAPQERSLLQTLFRRYARLVVEQEFLSGYSGARTFLALPIRGDGRADAYTIAKLGERESIRREFENYEAFVKTTLPPITARIQHPPVMTPSPVGRGLKLAALQYTFIGEPGSTPTSLRQALLADPNPELLFKLLDTFGPNWWLQRKPYTFRLGQEYDRMLPTHLVLEPSSGAGEVLDGRTPPAGLHLQVGQNLTLRGFSVAELRADGRSLSLRGQAQPGQPPLRVRWLSLERPEGATGRVIDTRATLLDEYTKGNDLFDLPDPCDRIPALLAETVSGGQSTVHGDLNLENVLVGPGDLVWLIDFSHTREGHTLFDFAHLEAEIIAHVLAPQIIDPGDYLDSLQAPETSPYAPLHDLRNAVHEIAAGCLFNPSQRREYQLASTLACLGALKFANLDRHAKHYLYLTAAHLAQSL